MEEVPRLLACSMVRLIEVRRNLSSGQQQAELERLCRSVEVVSVLPPQGELSILATLQENDRPILWAAISVRATHLLSGDVKAFGCLYGQTINGVSIMPPAVYLKGHRR
ncbi:MAG: hypothetical protein KF682_07215 [Nitrospira sp.]|nr:hypothetical protein [Nitrospira sp.]